MKYYKITNQDENHNDLQYETGLNVDPVPFNPSGDCTPGGIYFASTDILAFLDYGPWIRQVTLPDDAQVYENPGSPKKYKADKVILSERKKITLSVFTQLIQDGADVHASDDFALRWASEKGCTEIVQVLLDHGADVHADNDLALQWASKEGHSEVVKVLLDHGADVHADDDFALQWASEKGHAEVVQVLLDHGADVHARRDFALRWASRNGHTEIVRVLLAHGADVHARDDFALQWASENGHSEVVRVLEEHINKETS